MLLMAVGKRVDQYGVTEPRYFLLVLGLWGLGVALWYALTASRNIKVIPMTLAGLTLLTAFGPWGAYQVSRRSQLHRLDRIAAAAGMGHVGAITRPGRELSVEDRQEVGAIINYLYSGHGARAVTFSTRGVGRLHGAHLKGRSSSSRPKGIDPLELLLPAVAAARFVACSRGEML